MTEFKEIDLCGGEIIFHKEGSATYKHSKPTPASFYPVMITLSGDINDETRLPKYYDGIYNYFKECGIEEL